MSKEGDRVHPFPFFIFLTYIPSLPSLHTCQIPNEMGDADDRTALRT